MEIPKYRLDQLSLTQEQFDKIRIKVEEKINKDGITLDLNNYIIEEINQYNQKIINFFA